jgi:hypothetical protein
MISNVGVTLNALTNYPITVGDGGAGGGYRSSGTNGSATSFNTTLVAPGGGGGANNLYQGLAGGCGGGGGENNKNGGAGSNGVGGVIGFNGGSAGAGYTGGGGGGGLSATGSSGSGGVGGAGGAGLSLWGYTFGGGGGASGNVNGTSYGGAGGLGGGGAGNGNNGNGFIGISGTGGGGGGGGDNASGGKGGSGLVLVVYPVTGVLSSFGTLSTDASSNLLLSATSNLRLTATNVGINQTTPLYPLDVSGTGRFTSNLLTGSGTAAAPAYSFSADPSSGMHLIGTSQLAFDTSGVSRMVISNSNVGIGTSAPTVSLDVAGLMRSRIITSNLTDISFSADLTSTTGNSVYYYMTNVGFNKLTLTNPGVGNYNGIYGVFKNATTTGMSIDVCYNGAIGPATPLSLYSSNAITLIWNGSTYIQF